MSIHKDLNKMTTLAVHFADEHKVNYNIVLLNPVNGEFDPQQSTYEVVTDSYFETERPNAIIIDTTDSISSRTKLDEVDNGFKLQAPEPFRIAPEPFRITNSHRDKLPFVVIPTQYRRSEPKVQNNDPCLCGSGKKFKNCCKNN
jgi:hypothetical protein